MGGAVGGMLMVRVRSLVSPAFKGKLVGSLFPWREK